MRADVKEAAPGPMGPGWYFTVQKRDGKVVYESEAFTMSDGQMSAKDMCIINAELELAGQSEKHEEPIHDRNYELSPAHRARIEA